MLESRDDKHNSSVIASSRNSVETARFRSLKNSTTKSKLLKEKYQNVIRKKKTATYTMGELQKSVRNELRLNPISKTKFIPRTTIPEPFSLRTEERAKMWSQIYGTSSKPSTPTHRQFKARPMPNFDAIDCCLFLGPSSWKDRNFTIPEPFDFDLDRRMKMRSSRKIHDDMEVGRHRFQALAAPDFSYVPLNSKRDIVNLTVPFPFHLKIDERLANRIRFDGNLRARQCSHAEILFYIRKEKIFGDNGRSDYGGYGCYGEGGGLGLSETKSNETMSSQFDSRLTRTNSPGGDKSGERLLPNMKSDSGSGNGSDNGGTPGRKVRGARHGRTRRGATNISGSSEKAFPAFFKARKMPNFHKPFVPTKHRTISNSHLKEQKEDEDKEHGSRSFFVTPERRRSARLSMANSADRSHSTTRSVRSRASHDSSPHDVPIVNKFKAKPMPDFSKPPAIPIRSSTPSRRPSSTRNSESGSGSGSRLSAFGRSISSTPPRPCSHGSGQERRISNHKTNVIPFNLSKNNQSPNRYQSSQEKGSGKKFKARPLPVFYDGISVTSSCDNTAASTNSSSSRFKARPLPKFYTSNLSSMPTRSTEDSSTVFTIETCTDTEIIVANNNHHHEGGSKNEEKGSRLGTEMIVTEIGEKTSNGSIGSTGTNNGFKDNNIASIGKDVEVEPQSVGKEIRRVLRNAKDEIETDVEELIVMEDMTNAKDETETDVEENTVTEDMSTMDITSRDIIVSRDLPALASGDDDEEGEYNNENQNEHDVNDEPIKHTFGTPMLGKEVVESGKDVGGNRKCGNYSLDEIPNDDVSSSFYLPTCFRSGWGRATPEQFCLADVPCENRSSSSKYVKNEFVTLLGDK